MQLQMENQRKKDLEEAEKKRNDRMAKLAAEKVKQEERDKDKKEEEEVSMAISDFERSLIHSSSLMLQSQNSKDGIGVNDKRISNRSGIIDS